MLDPVTIRYTEALFNLARSKGELDRVRQDVERFAAELERPGVAAFVFDARVSVETRREKIRPFFAGASQLFSNFVDLLFDKRREEVLRGLAPESWTSLRYEDLLERPRESVAQIGEFLGLGEPPAGWVEAASAMVGRGRSRWRELPDAARCELDEACRPGFEALAALDLRWS